MSIKIDSTTDTEAQVLAAIGGAKAKESQVEQSASDEESDETAEASDASETEEADKSEQADKDAEQDATEGDESEDEAEDKETPKPKKKSGFKRRIDKLNQRLSETQAEIEFWKQKALADAKAETKEVDKAPKSAAPNGRPDPNSFDTHEEYVEALTEWKLELKLSEKEAKEQEKAERQSFEQKAKTHAERVQEFSKSKEDFFEVIDEVDHIPVPSELQELIIESDVGPQLMYELAKSPKEFARICKLPALALAREVGKIEAKLSEKSDSKTEVKKSKAPPPISPVGSKSGSVSKDPERMSFQEYKKWRESQLR